MPPLPMSRTEMQERGWQEVDVVFVSGDAYVDHPSFAMAILGRVLESAGFRVGMLCQPDWRSAAPWRTFGPPRLCFAISAGNMGPVDVSQGSLLIAAVVVTIPALMIVVSAAAPFPLVRWLSLGVGVLYILVSVSNLIGESWAYYLFFGVLEIGLAGLVVAYSYRWRGGSASAQASR